MGNVLQYWQNLIQKSYRYLNQLVLNIQEQVFSFNGLLLLKYFPTKISKFFLQKIHFFSTTNFFSAFLRNKQGFQISPESLCFVWTVCVWWKQKLSFFCKGWESLTVWTINGDIREMLKIFVASGSKHQQGIGCFQRKYQQNA